MSGTVGLKCTQRWFPPKSIENTFKVSPQSNFRSLEIHSTERRYKIFVCLPAVLGFEITRVQYYFPEIFGRILKYYESKTFLDSSLCGIFEYENCWFSFSAKNNLPCKGNEMRKIKL